MSDQSVSIVYKKTRQSTQTQNTGKAKRNQHESRGSQHESSQHETNTHRLVAHSCFVKTGVIFHLENMDERRVFLGGLPHAITEGAIVAECLKHAALPPTKVHIIRRRQQQHAPFALVSAFVSLATEEDKHTLISALHLKSFMGWCVTACSAVPKNQPLPWQVQPKVHTPPQPTPKQPQPTQPKVGSQAKPPQEPSSPSSLVGPPAARPNGLALVKEDKILSCISI